MGTWGAKIFDDDIALDVKDEYIEKLVMGTKESIYPWKCTAIQDAVS